MARETSNSLVGKAVTVLIAKVLYLRSFLSSISAVGLNYARISQTLFQISGSSSATEGIDERPPVDIIH
jgi:hypothetical protein